MHQLSLLDLVPPVPSGREPGDGTAAWRRDARAAQGRRCAGLRDAAHRTAPSPAGASGLCDACRCAHLPLERVWPRCPACHAHHPGVQR